MFGRTFFHCALDCRGAAPQPVLRSGRPQRGDHPVASQIKSAVSEGPYRAFAQRAELFLIKPLRHPDHHSEHMAIFDRHRVGMLIGIVRNPHLASELMKTAFGLGN
jgi:hypothetical protein